MIDLAHGLNMVVVAEGVETLEQLQFLRKNGCDEVQGFLFSKPVPVDRFEKLLRIGKCLVQSNAIQSPERRKYFRVKLAHPLIADMTILSIHGQSVNTGATEVLIQNIGPGGLSVLTSVHLPPSKEIVLQLETTILNQVFYLSGFIAWKNEFDFNINEYGFELEMTEAARTDFIRALNQLSITYDKASTFTTCRIFTEEIHLFFAKVSK